MLMLEKLIFAVLAKRDQYCEDPSFADNDY